MVSMVPASLLAVVASVALPLPLWCLVLHCCLFTLLENGRNYDHTKGGANYAGAVSVHGAGSACNLASTDLRLCRFGLGWPSESVGSMAAGASMRVRRATATLHMV